MTTDRESVDEAFEPYEPKRRVPLPVYWVAIALALWGALTLLRDSSADRTGAKQRIAEATTLERRQAATGSALFAERCATCHQADGTGVDGAIPPLAGSPFVGASPGVIVQILLHGIEGPISVNGSDFDGHMPAFGSVLDDDQLARLATSVRGTWGPGGSISPGFVATERARTAQRTSPWHGGDEIATTLDRTIGVQPAYLPAPRSPDDLTAQSIASIGKAGGWSCASCHGSHGEGRDGVPRLAGLSPDYIARQLLAFTDGSRPNDIMRPVAQQLTAADRVALGRLFASLATPSSSHPALEGDVARGAELALQGDDRRNLPSCFSCHGPSGFGVSPNIPSIAAQRPSYTAGRLAALARLTSRQPGSIMPAIAGRLSDADRRAVADYLATLPPSPATSSKDAR
ncbi:c-type cytochrome [Sphingopyxis sp.]|jgi:cytochrome c553|uniref:c-type cytochrome n=1 Tax=Sphingomonadales TaxID=204457 RepID=UPI003F722C96